MNANEFATSPLMRVLLVEDDEALRLSYPRALGVAFDATLAATVTEALAQLESSLAFDIVVSDLDLRDTRGRDGIWLLTQVRVVQPWASRVLFTGSDPAGIAVRLESGLLHALLGKPLASSQLKSVLRDLSWTPYPI